MYRSVFKLPSVWTRDVFVVYPNGWPNHHTRFRASMAISNTSMRRTFFTKPPKTYTTITILYLEPEFVWKDDNVPFLVHLCRLAHQSRHLYLLCIVKESRNNGSRAGSSWAVRTSSDSTSGYWARCEHAYFLTNGPWCSCTVFQVRSLNLSVLLGVNHGKGRLVTHIHSISA